jgi:hypothetical protein
MKLTIEFNGNTLTDLSRRILEAALRYLLINTLHIKIVSLRVSWYTAQGTDDTAGVTFKSTVDMEGSGTAELSGHALLDGTTLRGLEGVYSVSSDDRQDGQKDFRLKFSPLDILWIRSAASDEDKPAAPAPAQTQSVEEDGGWPDELIDDVLETPQDVFNFPYEFKSPGQLDFCLNSTVACMERTILELMDCQTKFIDEIKIPDEVCPGIKKVYLKPKECSDILYVETAVPKTAGPANSEFRFAQLSVDTAADITRYVMRTYTKQPLFVK